MSSTVANVSANIAANNDVTVRPERSDVAAEIIASVALIVYSLVVAAGFSRVFSGWEFFDDLVVITLVGHVTALALRLARVPVWIAFPISGAVLVWLIGLLYYRETYALGLPTSETWDLFQLELDVVGEKFRTAVAPVGFIEGWDVLASAGVAATVLLADTFAFRAYARAEALVPGGVLFVFVAALGDDRDRIASTMALVAAGVMTTVVLRAHHAPHRRASIGPTRDGVVRSLTPAVAAAVCVAVVAGVIGPRLPGADSAPLYDTKGGGDGTVTMVTSPLVDIRSRLTNRSGAELFVVEANADSYWRSSALPEFDGTTWRIPERGLSRADGTIAQAGLGTVEIRQTITISALGGSLLPAAADPIYATGDGDLRGDLRWNADSATLVKSGGSLVRGDRFEVISASPRYSPELLASATSVDPEDPIYLELPDDFPDDIRDTALEVTATASTPYEAALALQNWMRSEFTYSLEIQEGHSTNAIESFLRNRVGYCEQFAGSYAAMMRSIGIPARVAVGFTAGSSIGQDTFSVVGRNAHAWPEVWFDGIGWVPFEPTPGRGAPGAEAYTGVPAQQDVEAETPDDGDTTADTAPGSSTPAPTTSVMVGAAPATPTTVAPTVAPGNGAAASDPVVPRRPEDEQTVPWGLLAALLLVALVVVAPAAIRSVRRRVLSSEREQLAHLWARATRAVGDVGLVDVVSRTPFETATATADVFPVAARPMRSLAQVVTLVEYSPDGGDHLDDEGSYGLTVIENCARCVRQVERAVSDSLSMATRVRHYFTRFD